MAKIDVKDFLKERFGTFPEPTRCDNKGLTSQCPDRAIYCLHLENKEPVNSCSRCMSHLLFMFTGDGRSVTVTRIGGYRRGVPRI